MVLRVVAQENAKNRPDWFEKERCIRSMLVAAEGLRALGGRVHLLALVDSEGGVPSDSLRRALDDWDVRSIAGGSARRSWKAMLDVIGRRPTEHFDTVYLVEDDHLHAPDAFIALAQRGEGYSLLYTHRTHGEPVTIGDHVWMPAESGVSSFAMSRNEYVRSWRVLHTMSSANQSWDDITWHVQLGASSFDVGFLLECFDREEFDFPFWHPRTLYNFAWRLLGFAWARLRPSQVAWAVVPNLATHAEQGRLAEGVDWRAVAEGVPGA